MLSTAFWWFGTLPVLAQGPLINEVVPGGGKGPDWIEVFNPGRTTIDLRGYALVVPGRTHRIDMPLIIAAGGFRVLWCDRAPEQGPEHLDLKLPRDGGSLLLVDTDRRTVRDVFSWPELPTGVSLGRLHDGGAQWGFFSVPTPGSSNDHAHGADRLLPMPAPEIRYGALVCAAPDDAVVRYTSDGRVPQEDSPPFTGLGPPLPMGIFTFRAFAHEALASPAVPLTVPRPGTGDLIALRIDPDSLFDHKRGIFSGEGAANYARTGRDWQREAQVETHMGDSIHRADVRLAVSGSGTRGLPKKNLKLFGAEETLLRADATPHAFLRNLFIEAVATGSAHVDIQPSIPFPLYLNGTYEGLYRVMPAKNSDWLRAISGAESVELIDGPGARALKGDGTLHTRLLAMLESGAPLEQLNTLMEVTSLLDLACFDLYSGRADHDLNTRCWRPREKGGRWRWILFDMDLWAPPDERTVDRMCSATAPEAPYLPWLLKHEELRPKLLARLSAWLATTLAEDHAIQLADRLFEANKDLMGDDHDRWKGTLPMPSPEESIATLRTHIERRPAILLEQLERHTGQSLRKLTVRVVPENAGEVMVERLPLTGTERSFFAFAGAPLRFSAHAAPGFAFDGWSGIDGKGVSIDVDPAEAKTLKAVFRRTVAEQ